MFTLCTPAIIYMVFSSAQIIIDIYSQLYNAAVMKFTIALLITFLLNGLCEQGLGVVSWIIVFVPFILMTFVTAMLLYIFGLDASIGSAKTNEMQSDSIYIIKTPDLQKQKTVVTSRSNLIAPTYSTSPAYES